MAITRLQQARQMYAMGQRVGGIMGSNAGSMLVTPTRDGSRPGYYGPDAGHENDPGHGSNAPGGGDGGDKPTMADIAGPKTTTTQTMQDYMTDYAINVGKKADPRGGFFGDNTPEGKENNLVNTINFAPTKNPFNFKNLATNIVLGIVAPQLLGPKFATGMKAFNIAKTASKFANDIGLTDKNVVDAFTSNLTENFSKGKKSTKNTTTKNNTTNNGGGDGEGLASLDNQASGYDEYILLLQKLQSGNISDSERNRYNVLKNMLGI